MKKIFFTLTLLLCIACSVVSQTKVIAHRGFWKTEGSAQNSIAALQKADSIDCYGSELDVWLSKDNVLIVNHDPNYKGHNMQKSSSAKLTKLKLKNGEAIPTLKEYLEAAKPLKTKLIIELKSHNTPKQETKAVKKIIKMVEEMGLNDRVEYIAFSLHATKEFVRLAPKNTPVFYLNGDLTPQELKEVGCSGLDYNQGVLKKNPNWIEEAHKLGLKVNVWTVNKKEDMQWFLDHKVDFITTDEPTVLFQLLQKR